jgi:hypothetical protein
VTASPAQRHYYDWLTELGRKLGRPTSTLLALAPANDPFFADRPGRRQGAEWFAKLWRRYGFGPGTHLRRIHYLLISQAKPIKADDGRFYQNTQICWERLLRASRDARYLDLVPIEHFDDHRNDSAIEYLIADRQQATLTIGEVQLLRPAPPLWLNSQLPGIPPYEFSPAVVDQRYHVELWAEKTTANDILIDLAQQFDLNVVTASGEISATHCHRLIERAKASVRPVRILYISDFDPAGLSIPVACARKIEFFVRRDDLDLDIQVRPVALNHQQCVHYRLPRTPLKKTEQRAATFEARYGEGATELDALEALHPGELQRILTREIDRYYDPDLQHHLAENAAAARDELDRIRQQVLDRHTGKLAAIKKNHRDLIGRCNAELQAITKRYSMPFRKIAGRFNRLQQQIADELRDEAPDPETMDWAEPDVGDEDDDPLFDSRRGYIEQVDRFKQHQGKLTTRKTRGLRAEQQRVEQ